MLSKQLLHSAIKMKMMSTKAPVTLFKTLSHPKLDMQALRLIFIKAAWKAYTDIESAPISQNRFQILIGTLFDWIFLEKNGKYETVLHDVQELFRSTEAVELFLSDTFYILLNHYIKSFYGSPGGWEKISTFTTAIERFITYVTNRLDDESLLVFEDAFINILEKLRQDSETIPVLNTYYGVPIQYQAQILHTNAYSAIIRVHPFQETAAILQNGIYLLNNAHFRYDVYAAVKPIVLNGERVLELSRFDQLETALFHRQNIRVQPTKVHGITVQQLNQNFHCHLYDISIGGIAVTSKHPYPLSLTKDITLIFPSDIIGSASEIKGNLVLKSSYEGGYKYHFKIEPTLQQEGELGKYITRREQEIIKKLREEIV